MLTTVACGSETIVHNLEEREANKIIELLAENEISTTKTMIDTGRTVAFTITVPSKSRIDAIRLLNRHEMPRRADMGYTEVFKDSGLIPTAGEEKAKQMAALEGEIEKQLRLGRRHSRCASTAGATRRNRPAHSARDPLPHHSERDDQILARSQVAPSP